MEFFSILMLLNDENLFQFCWSYKQYLFFSDNRPTIDEKTQDEKLALYLLFSMMYCLLKSVK